MNTRTRIWPLLRPRFPTWVIANVVYLLVVLSQYQEHTVESGQGGTVQIFLWPLYWDSYTITDTVSAHSVFWPGLVVNYLLAVIPIFVILTLGWNGIVPTDSTVRRIRLSEGGGLSLLKGIVYFVLGTISAILCILFILYSPKGALLVLLLVVLGSVSFAFIEIEFTSGHRFLVAAIAVLPLVILFLLAHLGYRLAVIWIVTVSVTAAFLVWSATDAAA